MNITAIIGAITTLLPVIVINCIIGGYSGFLGSYRILQGLCTVLQRTYRVYREVKCFTRVVYGFVTDAGVIIGRL